MSFIDKIAASLAPIASKEDRAEARRKAEQIAQSNDWLDNIIDHHRKIEAAFDRALRASSGPEKLQALRELKVVFAGHSNAEESVIYPAVVEHSSKSHATMAYEEQAAAKINFAILENIDPMSDEWRQKLEHIQSAVQQHVYQEESSWFPEVAQNAPRDKQAALTTRYMEEFDRYCGARSSQPTQMSSIA
ncbi:hemerythrin domain-containing protein [Novosphingobium sp. M1R2S20]|uniref:Hemerythrin domain-containing protein n=1 Tax=Novosphingobium rhizovicinum TaxID=3228928 RepID=A0ABV3RFC9_9SPHN